MKSALLSIVRRLQDPSSGILWSRDLDSLSAFGRGLRSGCPLLGSLWSGAGDPEDLMLRRLGLFDCAVFRNATAENAAQWVLDQIRIAEPPLSSDCVAPRFLPGIFSADYSRVPADQPFHPALLFRIWQRDATCHVVIGDRIEALGAWQRGYLCGLKTAGVAVDVPEFELRAFASLLALVSSLPDDLVHYWEQVAAVRGPNSRAARNRTVLRIYWWWIEQLYGLRCDALLKLEPRRPGYPGVDELVEQQIAEIRTLSDFDEWRKRVRVVVSGD